MSLGPINPDSSQSSQKIPTTTDQSRNSHSKILSTRTKICLFLASNPPIALGILLGLGVTLPFTWPVALLLTGVFSLVFLSFAGASANLDLEKSIEETKTDYTVTELKN